MPLARPVITLTTDFGASDPYVGVMKGVILGINPQVSLVDLTHEVRPQALLQAAFLVSKSWAYFPPGTIHLVVVDPGVGTFRRAVLLETPKATFVAPDNGVLSHVLADGGAIAAPHQKDHLSLPEGFPAFSLTNDRYWLPPVSQTFHGRDVFAPVAAHRSLGVPPEELGETVADLVCLPISSPRWEGDILTGQVVHIDRFGNLVTDIPSSTLSRGAELEVQVGGRCIRGLSPSYAAGGHLLAIVGSYGTLEVAVKNGSAAGELGVGLGETVRVHRV